MAYFTGTAPSFADLKTAIYNACTANGWTLSNDIISKSGCFFKLTSAATYLEIDAGTSQSGSTLTGDKPSLRGRLQSYSNVPMSFPINYEIFLTTEPEEVICVINYNSEFYQHLFFGKSDIPDIGGTGAFFSANACSGGETSTGFLRIGASTKARIDTWAVSNKMSLGFFNEGSWSSGSDKSSFVHCGLDSAKWCSVTDSYPNKLHACSGMNNVASLLTSLPNLLNAANILLPVKAIKQRSSGGLTTIVNMRNARFCRIDGITPGETLVYGSEQWKFYPLYLKNFLVRNGAGQGTDALHSGTFGIAYRLNE